MKVAVDPRLSIWYIGFTDAVNHNFWFTRFLKPGFKHCYAFSYDAGSDAWVYFDPAYNSTTLRAFNQAQMEQFFTLVRGRDLVLCVKIKRDHMFRSRLMQTCASQLANLVGINLWWASPYRLNCALRKIGAQVSFLSDQSRRESDGKSSK